MIDDQVYNAVGGSLTVAPRVYAAVPGVSKRDVDEALWRLYLAKRVYLEEHTSPHHKERDRMIHAGGKVFVGASKRNPEGDNMAELKWEITNGESGSQFTNYGAFVNLEQAQAMAQSVGASSILREVREDGENLYWVIADEGEIPLEMMWEEEEGEGGGDVVEVVENPNALDSPVSLKRRGYKHYNTWAYDPGNPSSEYEARAMAEQAFRMLRNAGKDPWLGSSRRHGKKMLYEVWARPLTGVENPSLLSRAHNPRVPMSIAEMKTLPIGTTVETLGGHPYRVDRITSTHIELTDLRPQTGYVPPTAHKRPMHERLTLKQASRILAVENPYCATVDRRVHQNPENAPGLVASIQHALQSGKPIWVRTYAGAWGVREIKLSSDKRQALVKMGRQTKWTWLTGMQLEDLAMQAGYAQNPSLLSRASHAAKEVYLDTKHAITKKSKSAAALKRLQEAETPASPMRKFGLGRKGNPQFFRVSYRGYPDKRFTPEWRMAHNISASPTGHDCDFSSAAEAQRAANAVHHRGDLDHVIHEMDSHELFSKRNPESSAEELYETFHGRPSSETLEIAYDQHEHEHLSALGDLSQLKVITPFGKDCTINVAETKSPKDLPDPSRLPRDQRVVVASNEEGTQLYFVGGDQSVDVHALGFKDIDVKDSMLLGVLYEITYQTEKGFDNFELTNYYHRLGEETGVEPVLLYDPISCLLSVSGGQYKVKDVGIVN